MVRTLALTSRSSSTCSIHRKTGRKERDRKGRKWSSMEGERKEGETREMRKGKEGEKGKGGGKKERGRYLWVVYKRSPIATGRMVARCDELERLDDCLHRLEQAGAEHECVINRYFAYFAMYVF